MYKYYQPLDFRRLLTEGEMRTMVFVAGLFSYLQVLRV